MNAPSFCLLEKQPPRGGFTVRIPKAPAGREPSRAGGAHTGLGGAYLKAEAEVRGRAVLLLARDQGEDTAVLQVSQQLQVSGLLQRKAIGDGEHSRTAESSTCVLARGRGRSRGRSGRTSPAGPQLAAPAWRTLVKIGLSRPAKKPPPFVRRETARMDPALCHVRAPERKIQRESGRKSGPRRRERRAQAHNAARTDLAAPSVRSEPQRVCAWLSRAGPSLLLRSRTSSASCSLQASRRA